jgi:hypothetical protein
MPIRPDSPSASPAILSLPSCSRPSIRGLEATEWFERAERRPVLTATARDGRGTLWAGWENAPQGANQKMWGSQ